MPGRLWRLSFPLLIQDTFSWTFALPRTLLLFFLSSCSSSTMWWQLYCFRIRMSTATLSPGTGWCCFTVSVLVSFDKIKLHGVRLFFLPLSCESYSSFFLVEPVVPESPPLWSQSCAHSLHFGYLTLHRAATWSFLVTFYAVIQLSKYLPCFPTGYGFLRIAIALYFFIVSLEFLLMDNKLQKPLLHRTV